MSVAELLYYTSRIYVSHIENNHTRAQQTDLVEGKRLFVSSTETDVDITTIIVRVSCAIVTCECSCSSELVRSVKGQILSYAEEK